MLNAIQIAQLAKTPRLLVHHVLLGLLELLTIHVYPHVLMDISEIKAQVSASYATPTALLVIKQQLNAKLAHRISFYIWLLLLALIPAQAQSQFKLSLIAKIVIKIARVVHYQHQIVLLVLKICFSIWEITHV